MMAGRMMYKVEILRPERVTNDLGEAETKFVATKIVHAERTKLIGRRSEEVGEHFPDYDAVFNIRDAHKVEENWKLRQLGGNQYIITNIIPNKDKGMNSLICVRDNE